MDKVEEKLRGAVRARIEALVPFMLDDAARRFNSEFNIESLVDENVVGALASLALGEGAAKTEPLTSDGRQLFYRLKRR